MVKEKIDRINFLARKSKADGLTDEEKKEQQILRDEYRSEFRASMQGIMNNTYIQRPDGTKEKVKKRPDATC